MPRKVQPRWGDTGVAKVPDFKLSPDQLAVLAATLEIDTPTAIAKLKPLEWIGARYLVWLRQDEVGPSRAEQNAGLKKLLAAPQDAIGILAQLDYATQGRLLDVLWAHPFPGSGKVVEQLHEVTDDTLGHVLHCAELALTEGQKRRGSSPRKTLPIIIRWLASIYEETTGRDFTHNPYNKTEYTGTPQSDAGRFVTAFLGMVDPDGATVNLSAIEVRKRADRGQRRTRVGAKLV